MSKLVAIISYNKHSKHLNYGAALHSWAFQIFLNRYKTNSIIIDYTPRKIENYHILFPILNPSYANNFRAHLSRFVNWGIGFYSNLKKYYKFYRFFKNKTNISNKSYRYSELINISSIENNDFDTFVCESDVIWKKYESLVFDDVLYLNIPAANGKRKVAYAPSLGSLRFEKEEENRFRELVSSFSGISTREKDGALYLSSLLGKRIEWVLDPTLLLDAEDYESILKVPKERGYVLLYCCMENDPLMIKEAITYAKRKGKELIEISNWYVNKFQYQHNVKTDLGIEEFLGYFKYADEVICNAFHGFCFSVIFKKEVYLFQRDNSDYRMQNITEALGLSSRLIGTENKHIPEHEETIDYNMVYNTLAKHRERSVRFIRSHITN